MEEGLEKVFYFFVGDNPTDEENYLPFPSIFVYEFPVRFSVHPGPVDGQGDDTGPAEPCLFQFLDDPVYDKAPWQYDLFVLPANIPGYEEGDQIFQHV